MPQEQEPLWRRLRAKNLGHSQPSKRSPKRADVHRRTHAGALSSRFWCSVLAGWPKIRSTTLGPREYEGMCKLTNARVRSCIFSQCLDTPTCKQQSPLTHPVLAATRHDASSIAVCATTPESRVQPGIQAMNGNLPSYLGMYYRNSNDKALIQLRDEANTKHRPFLHGQTDKNTALGLSLRT